VALDQSDLTDIDALLQAQDEPTVAVAALRQRFPKLSVTQCDPSDVDLETPFRAYSRFSLHLVDSTDHCWRLTPELGRATGLLLVAHKVRP
jgi:hypothetical protein